MITTIITAVVALALGFGLSYAYYQSRQRKQATGIIEEAKKEAEAIKKDKILQAKEKFLELKAEHEKVINKR